MKLLVRRLIRPRPLAALSVSIMSAGLLPLAGSDSAAVASASHTLTIKAVETGHRQLAHGHEVFTTRDTVGGKYAGNTVLTGVLHQRANTVTGQAAIALSGGIIQATFRVGGPQAALTGRVTGGSGKYRGISGDLAGRSVSAHVTTITVTYTR